ncbi:MAG: hypothetical protein ACR2FN_07170 [Chitinophagaceae bacterium]
MKPHVLTFFLIIFFNTYCFAQSDPEFPRGFIMYLKLHNGMVTNFTSSSDLYIGGVQLIPQFTVVEHLLRVGAIADGFYTDKKLQAAAGPTISVKIKTFNAGFFGSIANINFQINDLWATNHHRLLGGGIVADVGNLITFGITAHRDYNLNAWWFQNELGIRISQKKKVAEPFNQ